MVRLGIERIHHLRGHESGWRTPVGLTLSFKEVTVEKITYA